MSEITTSWPLPAPRNFEGQFVALAPFDAGRDVPALFVATNHPEYQSLWQFLPYGPFADEQAMSACFQSVQSIPLARVFTVASRELQRPVGMMSIMSVVPEHGRAELGHVWYAPEVQRTKVNTETAFLLLSYLFDELGYRRVEWKCHCRNEASKKAALRLGFSFEGTFRQHMVIKGKSRDTCWFSMLDKEWPERKANFQRWLYEDDTVSLSQLNHS